MTFPKPSATQGCQHVKSDRTPCRAPTMAGAPFCFFHDPSKAKERAEARRAGGRATAAAVLPADTPDHPIRTTADIVNLLAETINQVRRGEIDTRIANTVGYLAGICLKAFEQGEIEQRLAALEMIVNGQPSEGRTQSEQDGSGEEFVFETAAGTSK